MPKPGADPKPAKPQEPEYSWGETPSGQPAVVWEHSARPLWAQAVAERDGVLLMEKERLLYRRASNGEQLWEQPTKAFPDELAADANGLVIAFGAEVREIDPASGTIRWRHRPGGTVNALALDTGAVYLATRGPLFVLARADGKQLWRTPASWEPDLHPHPENQLLIVDDPEKETLLAYHSERGEKLWEFAAEGQPMVAGPVVGGVLLVSAYEAGAVALDLATGEVRWRLEGEGVFESAAVVLGDRAYLTDGSAYCVNPEDGTVEWRRVLEDEEDKIFSVRLAGDLLLAETWRGRLLALDPADGSLRWDHLLGQVHGLAWDERRLYLRVNLDQEERQWSVLAVNRQTGALEWELKARRMIQDLTRVGEVLVVELKNTVLVLRD